VPKAARKLRVEATNAAAVSRELWNGLIRFNRGQAGPLRYKRAVLSIRGGKGRLFGGLILQSYWKESYVELLWLSEGARRLGYGRRLMREAERRARRHFYVKRLSG